MARWFRDRSLQRGIPSVSLRTLLPDARFLGCDDLVVTGCSTDPRHIEPGEVYLDVGRAAAGDPGGIDLALDRGAVAVVVERPMAEVASIQVVVQDTRETHARLSQALAGHPARAMRVVAVVGRTGRRSAAWIARRLAEASHGRCGLIATRTWSDGVQQYPREPRDLDAAALARMLAAMEERGCRVAVIEASESMITGRSLAAIELGALVIPDLLGPIAAELDLGYRREVARLARQVEPGGVVVVPANQPEAELLGAIQLDARRVAFDLGGQGQDPDLVACLLDESPQGTFLELRGPSFRTCCTLPGIGAEYRQGALAAMALGLSWGMPATAIVESLQASDPLPGHLEPLHLGQTPAVFADDAATTAELAEALAAVRSGCSGQLFCLVTTDVSRRDDSREAQARAQILEAGADRIVLTVGHTRPVGTVCPTLDRLHHHFRRPGRVRVELQRGVALESILSIATRDDAILLAGPGGVALHRPLAGSADLRTDRTVIAQWVQRHGAGVPRRRSA